MANSRPKAPAFTSPKGTFRFPKLSEADYGTKDYPKPDGEYSVQLVLQRDDPATQAFLDKLTPYHQKAIANADVAFKALKPESRKKLGKVTVNDLFTEVLDQDTEEPTGEIIFKFSMKASGEYKQGKNQGSHWDSRPSVFDKDPKNVLIKGFRFRTREDDESTGDVHGKVKPDIWGGTVGKVSFEIGIDKDGEPGYFIPGTAMAGVKLSLTAVQVIELVEGGQRSGADYGFENEEDEDTSSDEAADDTAADDGDF